MNQEPMSIAARRASPVSHRSAAVMIGLGVFLGHALPAAAEASLETADGKSILQEAQFIHEIQFQGPVAVVDSTQRITNPSKFVQEAVYTFDLPVNAAVTGLQIRLPNGRTTSAAVVDAESGLQTVPDPDSVSAVADAGLLRLIARDLPENGRYSPYARATYELRLYPVMPGKVLTATVKWVAPLVYDDGRISLRIPQRGDADNLVRERVQLSLKPPRGIRGFSAVHGGGRLLGKHIRRASFTALPHSDLVIDAVPVFARRSSRPLVSFASVPIRDDFGALAVSVLTPPPNTKTSLSYERFLLVVDVSRSLGDKGLAAAAHLADALLGKLPANTTVEAIVFDRKAKRVFGSFVKNGTTVRKKMARELRPGPLHNGSDLGQALELAHKALSKDSLKYRPDEGLERGVRASTLMAVISDGMTPVELTGRGAIDRLGDEIIQNTDIFSLILVPDAAPIPSTTEGVMAEMALRTPGRAIAMRLGEVEARTKNLASELIRPSALRSMQVDMGATTVDALGLPPSLEPGQGQVTMGFYHGKAPKKLSLVARQRAADVRIPGQRDAGLARGALPVSLVAATALDFQPRDEDLDDAQIDLAGMTESEARRLLVKTASKSAVVTRHSAMVAVDSRDPFARDRLAMARKWGPSKYLRLTPPIERNAGQELRDYEDRDGSDGHGPGAQRTGELDRAIIERLIATHVVPKARVCYENALRQNHRMAGSLVVVIEIARGEVQHAEIDKSSFNGKGIDSCVVEAAYTIQVPLVRLGDDSETIGVARYPLNFRRYKERGEVEGGTFDPRIIEDPTTDPLGGLENP